MRKEAIMRLETIVQESEKNFSSLFGNTISNMESTISEEHMGYFRIKAYYIPLKYKIVLEHMEGVFDIYIYNDENGMTPLSKYKTFKYSLGYENIKEAIRLLKESLEENDFEFLIEKDGKYYYRFTKTWELKPVSKKKLLYKN